MKYRKIIFTLSLLLCFVFVASSALSGAAAEKYSTVFTINTKGKLNKIVYLNDDGTTSIINYTAPTADISPTYANLLDFGFKYQSTYLGSFASHFIGGNGYIVADNFDLSAFDDYIRVPLTNYYYYLVTFYVGCYASTAEGFSIDNVGFNCTLTSDFAVGSNSFFETEPTVIYDNGRAVKAYTYAFSSRDVPIETISDLYVGQLFQGLELNITPFLSSSSMLNVFLSDIKLTLYSETDVLLNGFNDLDDVISQNSQDIKNSIDNLAGDISQGFQDILDADAPAYSEDFGMEDNIGQLEDAEAAVSAVTPEWDPSVLQGVPSDLYDALGYIGDKLQLFLDSDFGSVVFFCLSLGLALTLVGRAVG